MGTTLRGNPFFAYTCWPWLSNIIHTFVKHTVGTLTRKIRWKCLHDCVERIQQNRIKQNHWLPFLFTSMFLLLNYEVVSKTIRFYIPLAHHNLPCWVPPGIKHGEGKSLIGDFSLPWLITEGYPINGMHSSLYNIISRICAIDLLIYLSISIYLFIMLFIYLFVNLFIIFRVY